MDLSIDPKQSGPSMSKLASRHLARPASSDFLRAGRIVATVLGLAFPILLCPACGSGGGGSSVGGTSSSDSDGDGLSDAEERAGWDISVDLTGHGTSDPRVTFQHVDSDPLIADSDGDGLNDFEECKRRTDPRAVDTDRDGLTDAEEIRRYQTNPVTVDTDGDARENGTGTPDSQLFDFNEIFDLHTSPTLADTDGDAFSDLEEADDPVRHPLIAEIPKAELEIDGLIDVFLNVEYTSTQGGSRSYGSSISSSQTNTKRSSSSTTHTAGASVTVGVEAGCGFPGGCSADVSASATASYEFSSETTTEQEDSTTLQQQYCQSQTDSQEFSVASSTGSIMVPMRIRNAGLSAFRMNDVGISVLFWDPGNGPATGGFKIAGTLQPPLANITVRPGERTARFEVSADDLRPEVIQSFLARPHSMVLEPALFNIEDRNGISWSFLTENTFKQTALLEIDCGDEVQFHRIATNAERDSEGGYAGILLSDVLRNILEIEYTTSLISPAPPPPPFPHSQTVKGLDTLLGKSTVVLTGQGPQHFWAPITNRPEMIGWFNPNALPSPRYEPFDFDEIRLLPGDALRLRYVTDLDLDKLYDFEEEFYGLSDNNPDFDGDTLLDGDEAKIGWQIGGTGRWVYSDPRAADADGDGLNDPAERARQTDPYKVDTDDDGLPDDIDPQPTVPGRILHVRQGNPGTTGLTWLDALPDFAQAVLLASQLNGISAGTVTQIWVARGSYSIPSAGLPIPGLVQVYGGFRGDESKAGERDSSPITNGTVLEGSSSSSNPIIQFNSHLIPRRQEFDGFLITGPGTGIYVGGSPTLRNLYIAGHLYGGMEVSSASGEIDPLIEACTFIGNQNVDGGAIKVSYAGNPFPNHLTIRGSHFGENVGTSGTGAISFARGGKLTIELALFSGNRGVGVGAVGLLAGTILAGGQNLDVDRCIFYQNTSSTFGGGAIGVYGNSGWVAVSNSLFLQNGSFQEGAAVFTTQGLTMTNCTVKDNLTGPGSGIGSAAVFVVNTPAGASNHIANNVLWGNFGVAGTTEQQQLFSFQAALTVYNNCIEGLNSYSGSNNIGANPLIDVYAHLQAGSPCIDTGYNAVDTNRNLAGHQPLSPVDLDGDPRIVEINHSLPNRVDMGAFEVQNQ